MTTPSPADGLPEPYAMEVGARFDESGRVLMELIVEPTSQEWCAVDKQPLFTADQMREYALATALRLREGWRPIESAPKDGRRVLVVAHGRIPYVARYETGEGWLDENGHYREPIVWMPLPAPPTADDLARILENER